MSKKEHAMVVIATKRRPKIRKIPAHLVYEELDGQALPYRGYLEDCTLNLAQLLQDEEIDY